MQKVLVHTILMGDVEDPDLFVADPIWRWQQTEQGQWIMQHSVQQPMWERHIDPSTFGYRYHIMAWLQDADLTYWKLKHG